MIGQDERSRQIYRAGMLTIGVNIVVTVLRALAGWLAGSTAVLADAANSGTDVLATLVVLGGTRVAAKPPDPDHPYGHEKAEPVAAKIVGLIVTLAGALSAAGAIRALRAGSEGEHVGLLAVWVTLASIVAKELMARYLVRVGRRTQSGAVLADAANQRTDVIASLAALAGALGGRFGLPVLDAVMGVAVSGLILRTGVGLYWRSVTDLMDRAPEPETMARLENAAASTTGVISVDEVKARVHGAGIYVDCKVCVDAELTVAEGHEIAHGVKAAIFSAVPESKDVLVHVNPCRDE